MATKHTYRRCSRCTRTPSPPTRQHHEQARMVRKRRVRRPPWMWVNQAAHGRPPWARMEASARRGCWSVAVAGSCFCGEPWRSTQRGTHVRTISLRQQSCRAALGFTQGAHNQGFRRAVTVAAMHTHTRTLLSLACLSCLSSLSSLEECLSSLEECLSFFSESSFFLAFARSAFDGWCASTGHTNNNAHTASDTQARALKPISNSPLKIRQNRKLRVSGHRARVHQLLPDMAYARPDAAGTVVIQGPELSSNYFGICDGGATECLYGCLCPCCMAAQLKTELDGRPCGLCDCLCSSFPHNNLALRRQLRRKYGLELSVSTENCGCCACTGSYAQDCWCVRLETPQMATHAAFVELCVRHNCPLIGVFRQPHSETSSGSLPRGS